MSTRYDIPTVHPMPFRELVSVNKIDLDETSKTILKLYPAVSYQAKLKPRRQEQTLIQCSTSRKAEGQASSLPDEKQP